jgi:hypothetical protein
MMVSSAKSALIILPFLIVIQPESGTRKAYKFLQWSDVVINKAVNNKVKNILLCTYKINLFCTGSVWASHIVMVWYLSLLYTITDHEIAFLVPDSGWITIRNGKIISADFAEDTIINDESGALFITTSLHCKNLYQILICFIAYSTIYVFNSVSKNIHIKPS